MTDFFYTIGAALNLGIKISAIVAPPIWVSAYILRVVWKGCPMTRQTEAQVKK